MKVLGSSANQLFASGSDCSIRVLAPTIHTCYNSVDEILLFLLTTRRDFYDSSPINTAIFPISGKVCSSAVRCQLKFVYHDTAHLVL